MIIDILRPEIVSYCCDTLIIFPKKFEKITIFLVLLTYTITDRGNYYLLQTLL